MGPENKHPKRLTQKQINQIMQEIDIIKKHYKQKYSSITIEKNYEKHRKAIKEAIKHLKQLIEEASEPIKYRETIKPKGSLLHLPSWDVRYKIQRNNKT